MTLYVTLDSTYSLRILLIFDEKVAAQVISSVKIVPTMQHDLDGTTESGSLHRRIARRSPEGERYSKKGCVENHVSILKTKLPNE